MTYPDRCLDKLAVAHLRYDGTRLSSHTEVIQGDEPPRMASGVMLNWIRLRWIGQSHSVAPGDHTLQVSMNYRTRLTTMKAQSVGTGMSSVQKCEVERHTLLAHQRPRIRLYVLDISVRVSHWHPSRYYRNRGVRFCRDPVSAMCAPLEIFNARERFKSSCSENRESCQYFQFPHVVEGSNCHFGTVLG